MDRLSSLPDEIICHIVLSFLSAKEAAFASVLSKRWRNLFTIIPGRHFANMYHFRSEFMDFVDFVDGVLALPLSTRIGRFSLRKCLPGIGEPAHYDHINRCISNVLKHGVVDVDIRLSVGNEFSLPSEIFTCKTIVTLKLEFGFYFDLLPPEKAFLPAVETLSLSGVRFNEHRGCSFKRLLSACPVLVELLLHEIKWEYWEWSRTVSSPTLKRLTIKRGNFYGFEGSDFGSITFDTPSLVFLEYVDFVPDEYPFVNFDSLVEAKLDLVWTVDHTWNKELVFDSDNISSDPTNLLKGLKNVQILALTPSSFETFYFFREAIPVFENLYHLSIQPYGFFWPLFLRVLLKKSPNLETLVIKGSLHDHQCKPESVCECMSGYSCLLSCPVKVLVITRYKGTKGELEQIKHFLGKLSCLELVTISFLTRDDDEKLRLTTDLLMLPIASVNCKIQIKFSNKLLQLTKYCSEVSANNRI